jgi:glutamate mutase epsilon subunit
LALTDLFLFIHQKAASFQVLDDIASLRQGIASIAMNAGSVDNALQAVAGLTQQQALTVCLKLYQAECG